MSWDHLEDTLSYCLLSVDFSLSNGLDGGLHFTVLLGKFWDFTCEESNTGLDIRDESNKF